MHIISLLLLQVAFIGKQNQTNKIICNFLQSNFDAEVDFIKPSKFLSIENPSFEQSKELIIIDLNTSSGYGSAPDNILRLNKAFPSTPVLVLDHHEDNKFLQPLIKAGASGIISNMPAESKLALAISEILNGNTYYDFPD